MILSSHVLVPHLLPLMHIGPPGLEHQIVQVISEEVKKSKWYFFKPKKLLTQYTKSILYSGDINMDDSDIKKSYLSLKLKISFPTIKVKPILLNAESFSSPHRIIKEK